MDYTFKQYLFIHLFVYEFWIEIEQFLSRFFTDFYQISIIF